MDFYKLTYSSTARKRDVIRDIIDIQVINRFNTILFWFCKFFLCGSTKKNFLLLVISV